MNVKHKTFLLFLPSVSPARRSLNLIQHTPLFHFVPIFADLLSLFLSPELNLSLRFCVVVVKFGTPPPMIMDDTRCVSQDERRISLSEVYAIERKLWEAISVEGPVGPEARRLYRLVVTGYEDIILKEGEQTGLQEVEYSLWKLHYVHIEEFRKRFKNGPATGASNGVDGGIESFLSEATEYYKGLVGKLKELIGKDGNREMTRTSTRKFLCHRFLICIGDLARYKELYQFTGNRDCDWSVAAAYYLEATRLWPEGGNPHNQLALLATYVGDDFLALYHCVRSLAINEPFPDAWKNLVVLFDKSRSSMLNSIPDQASFDFSRPSRRMLLSSDRCSSEERRFTNVGGNLWRNFVRTISFFFIDFSSVDFESSFASMIKELESLIKLDNKSLNKTLESYQFMNPSRTGPFRAIQAVSVLIFVFQSLIHSPDQKAVDDIGTMRRNLSVQYGIAAMFIFMGRLVDQCQESIEKIQSPLLPAVLVFSEWLAMSNLDSEGICGGNEMSRGATSYFFRSFVRLLNLLKSRSGEVEFEGHATLWEDYELRGFSAATSMQAYLDFSYDSEHVTSFRSGHECRINRIIVSGIKIAEKPLVSYEQFVYDEKTEEFCYVGNVGEGSENRRIGETASEQSGLSRSFVQEEEEVIVFKPLTRHNSAPASKLIMPQGHASEGDDPMGSPDERLLRTSTTLPTQDQGGNDEASSPWEFPVSSGPPSLSAWVLDGKSSAFKKEKAENRVRLPPIEETLADLSIGQTSVADDSVTAPSQESVITHYPCPPYSAVVPSAPLLPEDTVFGVPENYYGTQPGRLIHSNQASAPSLTGFVDVYPLSHPMTSSEWLRQFREINNLQQGYDNNGPRWHGPNHFHDVSVPRYDHLHWWGNGPPITTAPASDHMFFYSNQLPQPDYYLPTHGPNEHYRRDRISYGYPRTTPYGYGAIKNDGVDQETLLHYLKQTEWRRLQKDPNLRGPTF